MNHEGPRIPPLLSWLFPYKRKGLSIDTQSSLKYYVFQNKISLTIINWLFQGMRSMGAADLVGKVLLEIILFSISFVILEGLIVYRIIIALIVAHTINWMINAHFWDVGRFIGITRTPPDRFFPYLRKVMDNVNDTNSIVAVIVIGGISRNAGFKETSDVDMIFIKEKGVKNATISVLVTVRERAKAFITKFPLHLELYDSMSLVKHRTDEVPIVLKDVGDIVKTYYKKAGHRTANLDDYDRQF